MSRALQGLMKDVTCSDELQSAKEPYPCALHFHVKGQDLPGNTLRCLKQQPSAQTGLGAVSCLLPPANMGTTLSMDVTRCTAMVFSALYRMMTTLPHTYTQTCKHGMCESGCGCAVLCIPCSCNVAVTKVTCCYSSSGYSSWCISRPA